MKKRFVLVVLLSCITSIAALADKINRVTVTLPGYACKAITYNNGQGTIQKDSDGNYTLTNYNNYMTGDSVNYAYTCWNPKGETPPIATVVNLSGSFAYIDPTAWFHRVYAGVSFKVDNQPAPCDYGLSVAYITSAYFKWCKKMANMGSSGGKDGFNNWWVNTPNIYLNDNWQSVNFVLREWQSDGESWSKYHDGVSVSIIQAYSPF